MLLIGDLARSTSAASKGPSRRRKQKSICSSRGLGINLFTHAHKSFFYCLRSPPRTPKDVEPARSVALIVHSLRAKARPQAFGGHF